MHLPGAGAGANMIERPRRPMRPRSHRADQSALELAAGGLAGRAGGGQAARALVPSGRANFGAAT